MEYPKAYSADDIKWLQENFEPEYMEECKKRQSAKDTRYLTFSDAIIVSGKDVILRYNKQKLNELGGRRLVVLYEQYSDFEEASRQLKIKPSNLRSHIKGIRLLLQRMKITPLIFDRLFRCF